MQWRTIPNLGRTLSGVTPWPLDASPLDPGRSQMSLQYPLHLFGHGEVEVTVTLSPNLDLRGRDGLRFGVSFDDDAPTVVTVRADPTPGHDDFDAWSNAVSDSVIVARTRLHIDRAGAHRLTLWAIDPGLVFQRVVVARGTVPTSYLGPPESVRR
jgi:hypothetical protein